MGKLVYLSIGSNQGERFQTIKKAVKQLNSLCGNVSKISSIYESKPVGFVADTDFLNLCIEIDTHLSPIELLSKTQQIEVNLGRKEKTSSEYESRPIDIDIILMEETSLNSKNLQIPHPHFKKRKFVLIPLLEIINESRIEYSKRGIINLIDNCFDDSILELTKYSVNISNE